MAVIVEDRAEIEPAPANDLQICEVSLPKLVDGCGFVSEPTGSLDDNEGETSNQIVCLQYPIFRSL